MEFHIFQGHELQIKQFYSMPIMHGYIECCNYAEGAKKNWDRFVNKLPAIFGDWSEHKLYWKHLDEPPTVHMGYMTPEGLLHWTGYYVAVELESRTSAKKENDYCFSHYRCTMAMDRLDTNDVWRRLHKMDWINEAVDLEVG